MTNTATKLETGLAFITVILSITLFVLVYNSIKNPTEPLAIPLVDISEDLEIEVEEERYYDPCPEYGLYDETRTIPASGSYGVLKSLVTEAWEMYDGKMMYLVKTCEEI